jgi:Ca2+-binding EF-hand superfamily protein
MMRERAVAVAVATLLGGTVVLADARAQMVDQAHFQATDLNGDGVVDREEFHRRMMDVMLLSDTDKDAMLSMEELPGVDSDAFTAADRDGDGLLSGDEFMDARFVDFEAADLDDSGTLSAEEVGAYQ